MPIDHERLTDLFGEAIELEAEPRAAFLNTVHVNDPELARELAALLDEDVKIVTALRTAGMRPSDFAPGAARTKIEKFEIPGYRLVDKLGEGGMGVVYSAEPDPGAGSDRSEPDSAPGIVVRAMGTDATAPMRFPSADAIGASTVRATGTVAVKVLHAASSEARSRFEAEAAIMRTLDHPGIARMLATGEAAGHPYIVMELIEGQTLDVHVRTHTPPARDRIELIASACDAVQHAHENGVIHRDLKPANLMVRPDGTIAVLDFGVARAAMMSGATRPGDFLGTPLYMSPEQAMAHPDKIDPRSDVYSLGVTLFELVAGVPPLDLVGLSLAAAVRKIMQHPPRGLDHDPILDAIVARSMAKDPAARHPSCKALAAELRRYLRPQFQ